jgi:hypothetical protein
MRKEYAQEITDLNSLMSSILLAYDSFSGQVWWRGQRDCCWELKPYLFRMPYDFDVRSGILRFQKRAISRYSYVPAKYDDPDWLFLMQHYRFPTRLLDWTESPLIAAYFASEIYECHQSHPKEIDDSDGVLFALSPYLLNMYQIKKSDILMPEDLESIEASKPDFYPSCKECKYVIAIRPSEVDIRLMVQISVFTLNGYNISLENLPNSDEFILKFKISKENKREIREGLKKLGIYLSTIFPDLEHLSEEIRELKFKPNRENNRLTTDKLITSSNKPNSAIYPISTEKST